MANWDRSDKNSRELKKAHSLESDLKKAKEVMAVEIKKPEASNEMALKSLMQVDIANEKMNTTL